MNNQKSSIATLALIVLTLSGYPLVASFSVLIGAPNQPISIAMRSIILICAGILIFSKLRGSYNKFPISFAIGFFIFWSLYLVRLLFDLGVDPDKLPLPGFEYLVFGIGTCLIPAVGGMCVRIKFSNARNITYITSLSIATALITALAYLMLDTNAIIDSTTFRWETETLNPISLGHLGASLTILSIWYVLSDQQHRRHKLALVLFFVGLAVGLTTLLLSASRGPILSSVIVLAIFLVKSPRRLVQLRFLIPAFLCASTIFFVTSSEEFVVFQRVSGELFQDDVRKDLLRDGVLLFLDNPILGKGIEPLWTYPHNLILESFMALGVVGGMLLLYLLSSSLLKAWNLISTAPQIGWIPLIYIQYSLGAMTSGSLYGSGIFWTFMTLVVSLHSHLLQRKNSDSFRGLQCS